MSDNKEVVEGASFSEQIIESARRNNTELLLEIKSELNNDSEKLSRLINTSRESITNNAPLHLACHKGNWEFIDIVLDIEGVEIDPRNREGSTPLHLAVKYCSEEPEHGYFVVDNLLDAGSDPRIRDNHKLRPVDYVKSDNFKLKELLEGAEYAISAEAENMLDEEDDASGDSDGASASE